MRRGECAFELSEQPCSLCGKPSGQLGTCEDSVFCPTCHALMIEIEGARDAAETSIRHAEQPTKLSMVEDEDEDEDEDDS